MKTKVLAVFVMLSAFFVGCKNEKAADADQAAVEEAAINEQVKIILDVIVKKDDNFQVYYKNGDVQFTEEQSVWAPVKGSGAPQQVVFQLPKDVVPDLIRIDLGMSDTQEDIVLSGVQIDYLGKNFTTRGPEMANYFRAIEGTEADFNTGVVKAIFKDGKRVEPALYPQEIPLSQALNNIK